MRRRRCNFSIELDIELPGDISGVILKPLKVDTQENFRSFKTCFKKDHLNALRFIASMGQRISCTSSQDDEDEKCSGKHKPQSSCFPSTRRVSHLPSTAVRSRSALQNLPVELLLNITAFLPPVHLLSLSYTCRYFRQSLDCPIMHVLGYQGSGSAAAIEGFKVKRLELLCLLDRDGKIPQGQLICSACTMTHAKPQFSSESFDKSNTERACTGVTGRVWICPHSILNHNQVHYKQCWPFEEVPRPWGFTFHILNVLDDSDLQKHNVAEVLGCLHAPICPHLRLSSAFVSEVYTRHCQFLELDADAEPPQYCNCTSCVPAFCASCSTRIEFDEEVARSGLRTLRVRIHRHFDTRGVTSRSAKKSSQRVGVLLFLEVRTATGRGIEIESLVWRSPLIG